jgi:anti-sigma regulatory factor (Ser/Thr protein kinase)
MSVVGVPPLSHRALVHDGPQDLTRRVAPELAGALSRAEPLHVSLTHDEWDVLRNELGSLSDRATFLPADDRYINPGMAMAALHDFVASSVDGGAAAVWSIGSVQIEGNPAVDTRWARYETAVDAVLADAPLHGICAYDRTRSPVSVIDAVRRCHTLVDEPGAGVQHCKDHQPYEHDSVVWPHRRSTPQLELWDTEPAEVREALTGFCGDLLARERMSDLHLIATELVTNGMRHGDRPIGLQVWRHERGVVLEAWDHGPGIDDRWADLRPHRGVVGGGYGLWLVGQLSDQVSIGREDGRTVVVAAVHTG